MSFAGAACGVRWRSTWSTIILCLVLNIAEGRLHIIAFDFEDKLLKIYSNLFSFILFIWEHHADGLQILKSWSCHKKESISGKRREVSSVHQSWQVQSWSRRLDRKGSRQGRWQSGLHTGPSPPCCLPRPRRTWERSIFSPRSPRCS